MNDQVTYRQSDGIGYITLSRPEKLNALADTTVLELKEALYALDDDESAHVGIISGAGRAFSSGADVRQRQLRPKEELTRLGGPQGRGAHVNDVLFGFTNWKPVIAAVHGYAIGAGLHLALLCDLIVASEGAQLQVTEIPRGLDGSTFWALLVQRGAGALANDMALTGRFCDADEAFQAGVINRLAPEGKHVTEAEDIARAIMANPPLSVRGVVRYRRGALQRIEADAAASGPRGLHLTDDFHESAQAFIEKRRPQFTGH